MLHAMGLDWHAIHALNSRSLINEGPIAKQFVGQHLLYMNKSTPSLSYWLREGKRRNAEVDYVVARGAQERARYSLYSLPMYLAGQLGRLIDGLHQTNA